MKTIKVKLSSGGIKQAQKEIREYRSSIRYKLAKLMTALSRRGYKCVVQNISSFDMPYSTGELLSGAGYEHDKKTAKIYVISDHAVFVEFGTGVVGKENPYELASKFGYRYDVNDHGDDGWYYYTDRLHWTKGMSSRPYMHPAFNQLREEISGIAKEIFESDNT